MTIVDSRRMITVMEPVNAFVEEVIKETLGVSRKKWALLVIALLAGAMGAVVLISRARSASTDVALTEAEATQ